MAFCYGLINSLLRSGGIRASIAKLGVQRGNITHVYGAVLIDIGTSQRIAGQGGIGTDVRVDPGYFTDGDFTITVEITKTVKRQILGQCSGGCLEGILSGGTALCTDPKGVVSGQDE